MNKSASPGFPEDPKTTFLLSLLMGGGLYAGARGLKEVSNKISPPKPQQTTNELVIDLPSHRLKTAQDEANPYGVSKLLPQVLALLGGGGAGFLGASKLYEGLEKHQILSQNQKLHKQYLDQLSNIHSKVAEETPLVDKFCAGIANKLAEFGDIPSNYAHWLSSMPGKAAETTPGGIAATALALLGLGSAGATYHLGRKMDEAKEENRQKQTIPQSVRINEIQ